MRPLLAQLHEPNALRSLQRTQPLNFPHDLQEFVHAEDSVEEFLKRIGVNKIYSLQSSDVHNSTVWQSLQDDISKDIQKEIQQKQCQSEPPFTIKQEDTFTRTPSKTNSFSSHFENIATQSQTQSQSLSDSTQNPLSFSAFIIPPPSPPAIESEAPTPLKSENSSVAESTQIKNSTEQVDVLNTSNPLMNFSLGDSFGILKSLNSSSTSILQPLSYSSVFGGSSEIFRDHWTGTDSGAFSSVANEFKHGIQQNSIKEEPNNNFDYNNNNNNNNDDNNNLNSSTTTTTTTTTTITTIATTITNSQSDLDSTTHNFPTTNNDSSSCNNINSNTTQIDNLCSTNVVQSMGESKRVRDEMYHYNRCGSDITESQEEHEDTTPVKKEKTGRKKRSLDSQNDGPKRKKRKLSQGPCSTDSDSSTPTRSRIPTDTKTLWGFDADDVKREYEFLQEQQGFQDRRGFKWAVLVKKLGNQNFVSCKDASTKMKAVLKRKYPELVREKIKVPVDPKSEWGFTAKEVRDKIFQMCSDKGPLVDANGSNMEDYDGDISTDATIDQFLTNAISHKNISLSKIGAVLGHKTGKPFAERADRGQLVHALLKQIYPNLAKKFERHKKL